MILGVLLTPIVKRRTLRLSDLSGRELAVDANNVLYQFLALIRKPDGSPLTDSHGRTTSHLVGLLFRTTRLIYNFGMKLVFVFDGKPPVAKEPELEKRKAVRKRALVQWQEARRAGDYAKAFSKAVASSRLSPSMVDDAKRLLSLLGVPFVQAPSDAEAQAAYMASKGDVWAAVSQDYDSLLYGAPRLVRYVTITGKEFLPSKGKYRRLLPELIELKALLADLGLSRESLVDLALLVGTDFNEGVRGIGPKKALKLISQYGSIDAIPARFSLKHLEDLTTLREIFLSPNVTDDYSIEFGEPNSPDLARFLCGERDFSQMKVEHVMSRIEVVRKRQQSSLKDWTH